MLNSHLEYCVDGYNVINEQIESFDSLKIRLDEVKRKTASIFKSAFTVDIVLDGIGRLSIGLDEHSILCYSSFDGDVFLTSLGNKSENGHIMFYMGDYSLMSKKHIICYEDALDATLYWIEQGKLSAKISWAEELL